MSPEESGAPPPAVADDDSPLIIRLQQELVAAACPSQEIMPRFARIVGQFYERYHPDGLGIIGGETAVHLFDILRVSRVKVYGQVAEVIAYGTMEDGALRGCRLVTKGGSVGPDDAVVRMIDQLQGDR